MNAQVRLNSGSSLLNQVMRVITQLGPNSGVLLDANCTPKRCSTASEDQMPRTCKRVGVGNGIMTGSWRKVLIPTARMPRARVVTHFYEFLLVLTIYRNVLRNRLKRQYEIFHLSSGPTHKVYIPSGEKSNKKSGEIASH